MSDLTVSRHFVQAALVGAENLGFDTRELLIEAGISPELLRIEMARVSSDQFSRLMQILWNRLDDEFMGMGPRRARSGTFATMCALVIDCPTLEAVYRQAYQFSRLFDPMVSMELVTNGDQAQLVTRIEGDILDPCYFLRESLLVIWHRLGSWLIGQPVELAKAEFDYPRPPHGDEYRHIFHCPLTFESSQTALTFDKRFLSAPVIRDKPEMRQFLKTSPADLLSRPDESNTFTGRIRALIGRDFSKPLPDFEWIAAEMHTSPQTLRRRLKQENTSFQEIKDLLRRDMAIYYLSRQELPINDIATKVGFTEPSTFHRAFKKWTGVTPGAYREGERGTLVG
ncbi:Transcriptional regulator, AraC family [Marinobacter nitratireducens]|uniref:Transcriptional regulator, AraC family n=1 Tax=Marinobacter nitratireducens TaxID=1137280 RepID=A0A072N7F4_9GAMM|nr:AraC family transcriptional regulator [Marinobacter nitratireducens]KEF32923.1 Transcriptional regulator, AraC family [Marinobacter nitratireducens]